MRGFVAWTDAAMFAAASVGVGWAGLQLLSGYAESAGWLEIAQRAGLVAVATYVVLAVLWWKRREPAAVAVPAGPRVEAHRAPGSGDASDPGTGSGRWRAIRWIVGWWLVGMVFGVSDAGGWIMVAFTGAVVWLGVGGVRRAKQRGWSYALGGGFLAADAGPRAAGARVPRWLADLRMLPSRAWRWLMAALMFFPLLIAAAAANGRRLAGATGQPVRRFVAFAPVSLALWSIALLVATPTGFALQDPAEYSYSSATAARVLIGTSRRLTPTDATRALERAIATGEPEAVRLVLEAGSVDSVFLLEGWQAGQPCPRSPAASSGMPPWRFRVTGVPDEAALVRAATCAPQRDAMPFAVTADAARAAGVAPGLHAAIETGNAEFVDWALESGADLEARDALGRTPLMHALERLAQAQKEGAPPDGRRQIVEQLAQRSAGQAPAPDAGERSLRRHFILAGIEPPEVAGGPAPNADRDVNGATLLHAAAASGNAELARWLVRGGIDPRAVTKDGRTALHFARGREMTWYLLSLGLSADALDRRDRLPFHHAVLADDHEAALILGGLTRQKQRRDLFGNAALEYAPPTTDWQELREALARWATVEDQPEVWRRPGA